MIKSEHIHTPDLLQPLPIPDIWTIIDIDFVVDYPNQRKKKVIMMVVDGLTK
jgi:hypothetical protein